MMKSIHSHGSSSLLFVINKVISWHFVCDLHKVMTTLIFFLTFKLLLWRFLWNFLDIQRQMILLQLCICAGSWVFGAPGCAYIVWTKGAPGYPATVVFTFVGIIWHFFTKEMIESRTADRMGIHELRCIIYSLAGCGWSWGYPWSGRWISRHCYIGKLSIDVTAVNNAFVRYNNPVSRRYFMRVLLFSR